MSVACIVMIATVVVWDPSSYVLNSYRSLLKQFSAGDPERPGERLCTAHVHVFTDNKDLCKTSETFDNLGLNRINCHHLHSKSRAVNDVNEGSRWLTEITQKFSPASPSDREKMDDHLWTSFESPVDSAPDEYRSYFHFLRIKAHNHLTTNPSDRIVLGFVNGDIAFGNTLGLARSLTVISSAFGDKPYLAIGQRVNLFPHNPAAAELFTNVAQDYFFFNIAMVRNIAPMPRSMTGGVAFDNWFTGRIVEVSRATGVDLTFSAAAIHPYTRPDSMASHQTFASEWNRVMHSGAGPYGRCEYVRFTSFSFLAFLFLFFSFFALVLPGLLCCSLPG